MNAFHPIEVGEVFGDWTTTSEKYKSSKDNYLHYYIDVTCKCGRKTTVQASHLTSNKTKRCAPCGNVERSDSRVLSGEFVVINNVYSSYVKSARRRGIDFDLDKSDFAKLIFEPCSYCGSKPKNIFKDRSKQDRDLPKYTGVDRVDNTKGYLLGNVVSCCQWCNEAKKAKTQAEFSKWIEGLTQNYYRSYGT